MTTGARRTSPSAAEPAVTNQGVGMRLWDESALRKLAGGAERCLYVAKGPTGAAARDHLDFGAMAAVNAA